MSKQKFYLTTPIYYVNARPHIGHAYTTIAADVIARRHRLLGHDTYFLTGTDEHGQKIERSAAAAGIPPLQFADQVSASFRELWKRMGITNDDYIRTTDPRHTQAVQRLWSELCDRNAIYLSTYTGQYSVGEEMFVEGPPGTIGPDGKPTETVTEENYFFRLGDYQAKLIDLIESGTLTIQPEVRRNEVLSFLRGNVAEATMTATSNAGTQFVPGALKDLSISRSSFKWGIPVPGDEKHVIYVWLDALANYMTAIGYGSDDPALQERFKKYWPADLHLVGKEIIRFHCVYWPAFLLALRPAEVSEDEWIAQMLPKAVMAHGWLLFEESKMSKSRGNIVRTETILDAFGTLKPDAPKAEQDLFAADVLRYFLLREIPFGQDGSFSFDALVQRYNSDLANGYGNLVSRTLTLITKNFDGVPQPPTVFETEMMDGQHLVPRDTFVHGIELAVQGCFETTQEDALNFTRALDHIWNLIRILDGYITQYAPWKLANSAESADRIKLQEVLYTAAELIRMITALAYPVLPYSTAKVWEQLGLGDIEEAAKNGDLHNLQWGGLKPGTKPGALAPIFPRADKGLIQTMTDMEANNQKPATPAEETKPTAEPTAAATPEAPAATEEAVPETPQITIDDFVKIDLRVAKIIVAERIPKADKLLRLEVDLGYEKRQILSGIAEWYTPEELIGRKIVVIANLAPRKMRGLESHGMLLAASHGEGGKPVLATFGEEIELGSRLK